MDAKTIPNLATVENASKHFSNAGQTPGAIRCNVFKADSRLNSRGETIQGNGLAAHGAIIRRGRRVLIDLDRYGAWLAGQAPESKVA
jgi:hypothetical protein